LFESHTFNIMESYVLSHELKNKWQSQKVSKKFKNRHIKKSKPCRNKYKANKRLTNKKKRHFQSTSSLNSQYKSNAANHPEQQFISYNYRHINVTINISINYHTKPFRKNRKIKQKKQKKVKVTIQNEMIQLTKTEQKAVHYVKKKSLGQSIPAQKQLIAKLSKLSFNDRESQNVYTKLMHFMTNQVPLIIHVPPTTIPKLLKDTHYRNLFEIGTGGGCTNQTMRKQFETEMFEDVYSNTFVKATEKPKYGCLNIGLSPSGISAASQYGKAFMTLNNATVRWRASVTNQDSFSSKGVFGTMSNCQHLLSELSEDELQEICETAMYKTTPNRPRQYREIQIHGPVLLKRDIVSLHVPNSEKSNIQIYQKFAIKNACDLIWF